MINFRTKRQTIEDIQRVLINCVGIQATLTCLLQHRETKLLEYGTPEVNVDYIRAIRISTSFLRLGLRLVMNYLRLVDHFIIVTLNDP